MKKTVIVLGTWSSGSGAVSDYLSSRNEFYNPFGVNEFKLVSDPKGLHYLFKNCFNEKNLLVPSHVFEEFRNYVKDLKEYPVYSSPGKKKFLYNSSIVKLSEKFLKDVTSFMYYGLPHYKSLSLNYNEKFSFKLKRKLTAKTIPQMKIFKIIAPVKKDKFIKLSKKFVLDLIKSIEKKKIIEKYIILNNGADISDPILSSQYFYDPKIICVTRDPRDIFLGMKSRQANSTPWYDVKLFVKWYKYYFGNKDFQKTLKNKKILQIKFENFVNNFDLENGKICKFLNIPKNFKLDNSSIFDLNYSKKNAYKSKKFLNKNEFKYIEKHLKEYLQW